MHIYMGCANVCKGSVGSGWRLPRQAPTDGEDRWLRWLLNALLNSAEKKVLLQLVTLSFWRKPYEGCVLKVASESWTVGASRDCGIWVASNSSCWSNSSEWTLAETMVCWCLLAFLILWHGGIVINSHHQFIIVSLCSPLRPNIPRAASSKSTVPLNPWIFLDCGLWLDRQDTALKIISKPPRLALPKGMQAYSQEAGASECLRLSTSAKNQPSCSSVVWGIGSWKACLLLWFSREYCIILHYSTCMNIFQHAELRCIMLH